MMVERKVRSEGPNRTSGSSQTARSKNDERVRSVRSDQSVQVESVPSDSGTQAGPTDASSLPAAAPPPPSAIRSETPTSSISEVFPRRYIQRFVRSGPGLYPPPPSRLH